MDLLNNLILGLVSRGLASRTWPTRSLGCMVGTLIGVLPGIGPVATIAMLLPITFHLPPTAALIMLAGIYYGAAYGGSTTAILVNLPGEVVVGGDLPRRLPDGPQGPRRRRALDLGGRLVLRGHGRHDHHRDLRRTSDAHGAEIRPGRLLLADGPGPGGRRRAGQRLGPQGDRHGVPRPAVRPGGHRRQHRRPALHLRHSRALGRHRLRADRHGPVRHRRDRGQSRTASDEIGDDQGRFAVADPRGSTPGMAGSPARHHAGLGARRAARRRPDPRRLLVLYAGKEDLQDAADLRKGCRRGRRRPRSGQQRRLADLVHSDARRSASRPTPSWR